MLNGRILRATFRAVVDTPYRYPCWEIRRVGYPHPVGGMELLEKKYGTRDRWQWLAKDQQHALHDDLCRHTESLLFHRNVQKLRYFTMRAAMCRGYRSFAKLQRALATVEEKGSSRKHSTLTPGQREQLRNRMRTWAQDQLFGITAGRRPSVSLLSALEATLGMHPMPPALHSSTRPVTRSASDVKPFTALSEEEVRERESEEGPLLEHAISYLRPETILTSGLLSHQRDQVKTKVSSRDLTDSQSTQLVPISPKCSVTHAINKDVLCNTAAVTQEKGFSLDKVPDMKRISASIVNANESTECIVSKTMLQLSQQHGFNTWDQNGVYYPRVPVSYLPKPLAPGVIPRYGIVCVPWVLHNAWVKKGCQTAKREIRLLTLT